MMEPLAQINPVSLPPLLVLLLGLVLNLALGRDTWLRRTFEGPIDAANRFLGDLEQRYNRPDLTAAMRKADGISTVGFLFVLALAVGLILSWAAREIPFGWTVEVVIIAAVLVQRAHLDRTRVVIRSLEAGTEQGRAALALISKRETQDMERPCLARSSVEISAMVCFEGVIAPVLYYLVFGLPGLLVVRVVNTFFHMVREQTSFGDCYGWAARRLNNFLLAPAAPLAPVIVALATATLWPARVMDAIKVGFGQGERHFRRITGPVTAAFAGALDIRLGGPVRFSGATLPGEEYGGSRTDVDVPDIRKALVLFVRVSFLLALILATAAALGYHAPVTTWLLEVISNRG